MKTLPILRGSVAHQMMPHDFETVLSDASRELSASEYSHLVDIASVGFKHAVQKDAYLYALQDVAFEWVAETRRKKFYRLQDSMEIAPNVMYSSPGEVNIPVNTNQAFHAIPAFFVYFGAVVLALFSISATIFAIGFYTKIFLINPVYLFMITVGFAGLLMTDIVAIGEWRKTQNVQK